MSPPIVDIHFHPTLKPFGHSHDPKENISDAQSVACIWHSDPPTAIDELDENVLGFPPYREADFTTLVNGKVNIGVVSLYPIETGFVHPQLFKLESKELIDLITLFGRERVAYLQSAEYNYFEDLNRENQFLTSLHNTIPKNGVNKYVMISSGAELVSNANETLRIIVSIEGVHVFCNGHNVEDQTAWADVDKRIEVVKNWKYPPFFITLCHHFYNGLASHAKSLFIKVLGTDLLDQSRGLDQPVEDEKYITTTGYKVIDHLYSTANGRRILIDVKHMCKNTRLEFYAYRKGKYDSIPLISSHGALINFYNENINLDIDDINEIYNSNGLIGIELDQRVLGYNKRNRFWNWLLSIFRSADKKNLVWAEYFWKNILAIAEHCYELDQNADPWKIICLGSDFDGIINPLNKFRTSTDLQALSECILKNLIDYWASGKSKIPINHLGIDAHTVVYNIMYKNAKEFITKNY